MYFEREKTVCKRFIRRFKGKNHRKFLYEISTSSISILVNHKRTEWNEKRGKKYLNYLRKKFNLAYIGYRNKCLILRENDRETEYFIPMRHFNLDNYYSKEF